jgi:hypothetical protein
VDTNLAEEDPDATRVTSAQSHGAPANGLIAVAISGQ